MYILISTDGYNITTSNFNSQFEAVNEMTEKFNSLLQEETGCKSLNEFNDEMSFNNRNSDAALYTGENVYVWKIIKV